MGKKEVSHKTASDKLESPERLDALMGVTSPKGWIALLAIGVVLGGVLVWSIYGSIPERLDGQGILLGGGGLQQVRASGDGTLTKFTLKDGDQVKEGQVVGEISQIGSSEEIKTAMQALNSAQKEYETSKAEAEANINGVNANIASHDADLKRAENDLQHYRDVLQQKEENLSKGLVTQASVEAARRDVTNTQTTETSQKSQIVSLRAQITSYQQQIRAKLDAVDRARREFERLTVREKSFAQVTATVAGRVVGTMKRVGDHVSNNEVVATIEPPSSVLEPIVYVPSGSGKRIRLCTEAQISPTTIRREEYGFIKGKVVSVGEYPITLDAVRNKTSSEVAQELIGNSTKIEIGVQLTPSQTVTGYEWSSSNGPASKLASGTSVKVSFIVDRKPPLNWVLPIYNEAGADRTKSPESTDSNAPTAAPHCE